MLRNRSQRFFEGVYGPGPVIAFQFLPFAFLDGLEAVESNGGTGRRVGFGGPKPSIRPGQDDGCSPFQFAGFPVLRVFDLRALVFHPAAS
jgi:hypothetical protein